MAEKETAKDRLAKMIKESSSKEGGSDVQAKPVNVKATKKKAGFLQVVKILNLLLLVVIAGCAFFLFSEINSGSNLLSTSQSVQEETNFRKVKSTGPIKPNIQRLSYYLADLSTRNIFQPFENIDEDATDSQKVSVSNTISRKTSAFRLVGVAWFETVGSASAMIEDTNKKITYFLQRGDKIGDVIVKTIYADSVELGYQNEEIILEYEKSQM